MKVLQQRLEKELSMMNKAAVKEFRQLVTDLDAQVSDQRTKLVLDLLTKFAA